MVQLIGDEIWHGGERVAILVQSGASHTTMGDFTDKLTSDGCEDQTDCDTLPYDQAFDDLLAHLKHRWRGGLLKRTDLLQVIESLKEEG